MRVTLNAQNGKLITEMVKAGLYVSANEAVNAMLTHKREIGAMSRDEVDELRAEVDIGIAEANRGEFVDFTAEDVIAEGRARLAAKRKGA